MFNNDKGLGFDAVNCPSAAEGGVMYDYPLLRTMAKDLIQKLMREHTIEATELRYSLVRLSTTIGHWTPQRPPSDKDKHRTVNETIEAILRAQELLKSYSSEPED